MEVTGRLENVANNVITQMAPGMDWCEQQDLCTNGMLFSVEN